MKPAVVAVLSSVCFCAAAFAQVADPPPPPAGMEHHDAGMRHGGLRKDPGQAIKVAPVTSAPFSAKFTLDSTEQAPGPDGVVQKYTATQAVYRDSLGRTREDVTLPARPPRPQKPATAGAAVTPPKLPPAPRTVTVIADPVANTITRLMAESKTAVVETVPADYFAHMTARELKEATGAGSRRGTTTDLGSKTFAGVVASGTRKTFTMPVRGAADAPPDAAAAQGTAAAPMQKTYTHETWFSPDLKLEVSSTEMGGRITRSDVLTSFTKGEPDAALFKIPEGYTVKNAPPHMPGDMHRGGRGPGRGDGPDAPPPPPPAM